MAKVSFFLHKGNEIISEEKKNPNYLADPSKKLPIHLNYTHYGKRLKFSTKLFVNPKHWDSEGQRVTTKEPLYSQINDNLKLFRERLHNIILRNSLDSKPISVEDLKKELTKQMSGLDGQTLGYDTELFFWKAFNEFLDNSTNKGESTILNYKNTFEQLRKFSKKYDVSLNFSAINSTFIDKLLRFLFKDLKMTRNTAGKYLKNIKAFLNYCFEKKHTSNDYYKGIKVFKDLQNIIYLEIEEIKALKDVELTDISQVEARDFFLFGCFTGLRYSDISSINKSLVQGEWLVFTSKKTQQPQKTYLNRYALEILTKYNYSLPSLTIQFVNENIKKVAEKAKLNRLITKVQFIGKERKDIQKPLYRIITTHIAKKTFITQYFKAGGRVDSIQQTTGNKDRQTLKHYLEFTDKGLKKEQDSIWDSIEL